MGDLERSVTTRPATSLGLHLMGRRGSLEAQTDTCRAFIHSITLFLVTLRTYLFTKVYSSMQSGSPKRLNKGEICRKT